uniref:CUB domain-containing protein n=1 Tax=Steinernema glaseri TaxID=37863 RepID=A0A1I8A8E0_9BILA
SASKQKLGLFFTNANVWLHWETQNGTRRQTFDTDEEDHVQAISSGDGNLTLYVDKYFYKTWIGFEAVVGAYGEAYGENANKRLTPTLDDESTCPFVTGDDTVTVLEDEPRVAASHWDFSSNSTNIHPQSCLWKFAPKPGYTLKIVFPVFSISEEGESVQLSEDGSKLFSIESGEKPPYRVFYTDKNFALQYTRSSRRSGPDASRFVAVISSFPAQVVPAQGGVCSGNTTLTLTGDNKFTNIHKDSNLLYENNQECSWKVNTTPGKLLQFSLVFLDVENFADTLTLQTPSASVNFSAWNPYPIYATKGSEVAQVHWKSDGNYGRSGFRMAVEYLDCTCSSPGNIVLNETNKVVTISPSANSTYYCPSMNCHWTISSPPNTMLIVNHDGVFRGPSSTFNTYKDSLEISDGTNNYITITDTTKSTFLTSTVGWPSVLKLIGPLVSTLTGGNTVTTISSSTQHTYYNSVDFKDKFSSVTFTLSEELKGKKLQLYALKLEGETGAVAIIDGDLESPVALTTVQALYYDGHSSGFVAPFTSTTGSITILCLKTVDSDTYNNYGRGAGYDFFVKVYDDSRDCAENNSVYYVKEFGSFFDQSIFTAISKNLSHCPLTILKQRYYSPYERRVLSLGTNNIEGTDKNVKVLPGTDFTAAPFFEFNQKNHEKWTFNELSGYVFTILVPVGGRLNFTGDTTSSGSHNTVYGDVYPRGNPQNGIFMSPNYPYSNESLHANVSRSLYIKSDWKKFKVDFDVVVGQLSSSSSLQVVAGSKSVTSLSGVENITKSYSTGYSDKVTFTYTGPEGEKGFFIRYRMASKNGSLAYLSGIMALLVVFYNLMSS